MEAESKPVVPRLSRCRRWVIRLTKVLGVGVLLVLLLRELFFSGPYLPLAKQYEGKILDMHCHVAGIGAGGSGCFVSRELRKNFRFGIYLKAFDVTLSEVEEQGDQLLMERLSKGIGESERVGAAIVLAMDGVINADGRLDRERTEFYIPNKYVAAETAKHSNLHFGASINPDRPDALERLQWASDNGALLVKWLPSIQFIDPSDPVHEPFYRKLAELNLPLLTHAGQERSFTHARDELADPVRLRLPLSFGVTVIVAHVASTGENEGQEDIDRLIGMLGEYPNLYADISSMTQVNKLGYLRQAITEKQLEGRLLYGSDFPLINTAAVTPWAFPMNLTRKQMQSIDAINNPWDRDVALKEALGVPAAVMARPVKFFGVPLGQVDAD
ncbi:MAG: amidohydrolase family protein [Verrucomicrobiota bacterium]|nr:amidohydrolase family protein [Verrucomicrobiota bacterium]